MKARGVMIVSLLLMVIFTGYASGQGPIEAVEEIVFGKKYTSYEQVQEEVGKLRAAGEHKKAIEILEKVKEQFGDNIADTLVDLSYLYRRTKNYEKLFEVYDEGVKKDIFFEIGRKIWKNLPEEKVKQLRVIAKKNRLLTARYQMRAKPRYEVLEPEGYSAGKSQPLLMVLHGGNGTIERAKKHWQSKLLGKEYLVAFLQSSKVQTSTSFSWRNSENRIKDIEYCYKKIITKYPSVDRTRVYIGGFSAGGAMAMNMALRGEAPISGFIGVCPSRGRGYMPAEVERGVQRGVKAVIIAGEKDRGTKKLKEKVVPSFEQGGLACEFIVIEGLGHAFAEDFGQRIDSALEFLQKGTAKAASSG